MLETNEMLSVNQTHAQIKLVEMWKSRNIENYPIKPSITTPTESGISTRGATSEQFRLNDTPQTFIGDATRLWNQSSMELKQAKTLSAAKMIAKKIAKDFPI